MNDFTYQGMLSSESAGKKQSPMPSRRELVKRNSFPSVNENRYLDKILADVKAESASKGNAK